LSLSLSFFLFFLSLSPSFLFISVSVSLSLSLSVRLSLSIYFSIFLSVSLLSYLPDCQWSRWQTAGQKAGPPAGPEQTILANQWGQNGLISYGGFITVLCIWQLFALLYPTPSVF
jgi:hypothetical protein